MFTKNYQKHLKYDQPIRGNFDNSSIMFQFITCILCCHGYSTCMLTSSLHCCMAFSFMISALLKICPDQRNKLFSMSNMIRTEKPSLYWTKNELSTLLIKAFSKFSIFI